jgi:hypothetical protein
MMRNINQQASFFGNLPGDGFLLSFYYMGLLHVRRPIFLFFQQCFIWHRSDLTKSLMLWSKKRGFVYFLKYFIQHCVICRRSYITMSYDAKRLKRCNFLKVLFPTLLHLPPLRFHCIRGRCYWIQDYGGFPKNLIHSLYIDKKPLALICFCDDLPGNS